MFPAAIWTAKLLACLGIGVFVVAAVMAKWGVVVPELEDDPGDFADDVWLDSMCERALAPPARHLNAETDHCGWIYEPHDGGTSE